MPTVHKNSFIYAFSTSFLLSLAAVVGLFITHRLLFVDAKEFSSLPEWFFAELSTEYAIVLLLVFVGLFSGAYIWMRGKTKVN